MPINYRVDSAGLLIITASNPLTAQNFMDYFRASRDDIGVRTDMHRLFDFRGVDSMPPSSDVANAARSYRELPPLEPGTRIAVLVDSDLGFGIARMFAGVAGPAGEQFNTFRSESEAMLWLAVGASPPDEAGKG